MKTILIIACGLFLISCKNNTWTEFRLVERGLNEVKVLDQKFDSLDRIDLIFALQDYSVSFRDSQQRIFIPVDQWENKDLMLSVSDFFQEVKANRDRRMEVSHGELKSFNQP